jgi:pimeloyl-ACP methyl ester carboxylesterase
MKWLKKIGVFVGWTISGILVLASFTGVLWLTNGTLKGIPALLFAILFFLGFARLIVKNKYSTLGKSLRFTPILFFLLIVFWAMIPLGPDQVFDFPPLEGEERWELGNGRIVSMTHHEPQDSIETRESAILFLHGGPGAFVRDFDREFIAGFTDFGYEVFVYDQVGAGRSAMLNIEDYSHQKNVDDMSEIIKRIDKPVILFGQSYGTGLITSYLEQQSSFKHIRGIILSEPGPLPGAYPQEGPYFDEKTTKAEHLEGPGNLELVGSPRFVLGMTLPVKNKFVSQGEFINHISADLQKKLVATSYCKGDESSQQAFTRLPFNMKASRAIRKSFMSEKRPDSLDIDIPVMMLLGECSYLARGYAIDYFEVFPIQRSHWIPGVGHIIWGNKTGRELTREAVIQFLNGEKPTLPNEPTFDSRFEFIEAGK